MKGEQIDRIKRLKNATGIPLSVAKAIVDADKDGVYMANALRQNRERIERLQRGSGLGLREELAARAMESLILQTESGHRIPPPHQVAEDAEDYANALYKRLTEEEDEQS